MTDDTKKRIWDEIERRIDKDGLAVQQAINRLVADGALVACGLDQDGRMIYRAAANLGRIGEK
jgi:N-acetylmuramic acid 6-phosphate (MurNAc-6-P) etherase